MAFSSSSSRKMNAWPRRLLLVCVGGAFLLFGLGSCLGSEPPASLPPTPTLPEALAYSDSARLARPTLAVPQSPTQLDEGTLIYWGVCMACHGDRGQGLTDEWRTVFGEDQNCWASKCHAANHPPHGFEIPRDRLPPPLAGPGALSRFSTAQELYEYTLVSMPWWNPHSLTPERAWAVTARLLQMNGTLPAGVTLDATSAAAIPVHRLVTAEQAGDQMVGMVLAAALGLASVMMAARMALSGRRKAAAAGRQTVPPRRPSFFLHLHPPTIPARQARWRHTLGAGGLAVFFSLVLLVTGALEMFYYVPRPEQATISIQTMAHLVPFGGMIRNLHYWSAQGLLATLLIHFLRVVLTGAYGPPRRFNYFLGLALLLLTVALAFTGYVLRWDQGISWALVVGTNLLNTIPRIGSQLYEWVIGGAQPGAAMLLRFYSWHIFGLTLAVGVALVWHLFRVRRDGGIAAPLATPPGEETRLPRAALLQRELLAMAVAGAFLILLSVFRPAPVTPPLRETVLDPASARAPWFFLWIQQLLKFGNPFLLGVLAPLAVVAVLAVIPYLFPAPDETELGRWFPKSGRAAQLTVIFLAVLLALLTVWALLPAP